MHAFVSYAREDYVRPDGRGVGQFCDAIRNTLAIELWVDTQRLRGSLKWEDDLQKAVADAACVLFFASSTACVSEYCPREIAYAYDLKKPIVPLLIEPLESFPFGRYPSTIAKALFDAQHHVLYDDQSNDWLYPLARQLSEAGFPALERFANDARAIEFPHPHKVAGVFSLGQMLFWQPAAVQRGLERLRKRLAYAKDTALINLGIGLCMLVLDVAQTDMRTRLEEARAGLPDVADAAYYAALGRCARRPLRAIKYLEAKQATDWLADAMQLKGEPGQGHYAFLLAIIHHECFAANAVGTSDAGKLIAAGHRLGFDPAERAALLALVRIKDERLRKAIAA